MPYRCAQDGAGRHRRAPRTECRAATAAAGAAARHVPSPSPARHGSRRCFGAREPLRHRRSTATAAAPASVRPARRVRARDRKSTRLNSSHVKISYAVFCLKKKKKKINTSYFLKKKKKKQKTQTTKNNK